MKLLVFEYATAMGIEDPSISAEGNAMLNGILDDLSEYKPTNLISKPSDVHKKFRPRSVDVDGNLTTWLNENLSSYDACLPIVPEENNLLHDITVTIEENGVEVLGSNSKAVKIATNKFETYNILKSKIPVVETKKIFFNEVFEDHERYTSVFDGGKPKVVKPADGVSCSGVKVVCNEQEFIDAQERIKHLTEVPYFLLQDMVSGVSASVSLLTNGNDAVPISLNFQDVKLDSGDINYNGGTVPLIHELSEIAKENAVEAVKSIKGMKGYVGVDMLLDNNQKDVHLVEINSRLTTPYIVLRKLVNFNLGEAIIDSVKGSLPSKVELKGAAKFNKEGNTLRISVLK